MGSIEIFASLENILITASALFALFITVIYSEKSSIGKIAWFVFIALLLEFSAAWIGHVIKDYYEKGMSINILVFVELTVLLISMIFLSLAASRLLLNKDLPDTPIISVITTLGMIAIIYFVIIMPDGKMVNNMRQIFPLAGFGFVTIGLLSHWKEKYNSGFKLASVFCIAIMAVLILKLFNVEFWYSSAVAYLGLAAALLMINNDFANRKLAAAENEINKYNRRIEEIIKLSPFPIIISRLSDDKLILANNNAVKLFGIQPKEIERYRLKDFFADAENRRLLNEKLEQEREVQDFEILVKTSTGTTPFWLLTSANIIDYNYDIAIYSAFQDITTRKNRENLLKNQAVRDPLTSLFNRRYFEEEVSKRIAFSKAHNGVYSVMMLDADHFKKVNDTYGHKVGDKVLIELAATCERALREDDIVARYGGEEFVIFLANTPAESSMGVADRLRETISKLVVYSDDGKPINFTVSIGISSSEVSDNIDILIKTADDALYRAKNNGRNRCELFTREDMKNFNAAAQAQKEKTEDIHPVFANEETEEISLLDGVGENKIITQILDLNKK